MKKPTKREVAQTLEIPQTLILDIKAYLTHTNVITTDHRKHRITPEQLAYATQKKTAVTPPPDPSTDDLTDIVGIGPATAERLIAANITTFAQLAAATPEAIKEATQAHSSVIKDWQAKAAHLAESEK